MLGQILGIGGKLLDKLIPDKGQRDKLKMDLARMQQDGELKELEVRMSAIIAEAKSSDPWTSRARPTFMYVMYIMILFSIPMGILSAFRPEMAILIAEGMKAWLGAIPDAGWGLFGVAFTGYTAARSFDKKVLSKGKI